MTGSVSECGSCWESFFVNKPLEADRPDLEALKKGVEKAWEHFFLQFDKEIRAIAAWPKWRFDAHTREDVVQIIKLAIVKSIKNLQSEQALHAFVRKICVHRCIDMLRKRLREQGRFLSLGHFSDDGEWEDLDIAADDEYDPVTVLLRAERVSTVRTALARMDAPCQKMIRQFYIENRSYREIAESDGISINTVGSRLSRCLNKLRPLLKNTEISL